MKNSNGENKMKNTYIKLSGYEHRHTYNAFDKWIRKNRHKLTTEQYYLEIEQHNQMLKEMI